MHTNKRIETVGVGEKIEGRFTAGDKINKFYVKKKEKIIKNEISTTNEGRAQNA